MLNSLLRLHSLHSLCFGSDILSVCVGDSEWRSRLSLTEIAVSHEFARVRVPQNVEGGNKACGLSSHGADQVHRQQQSLEDSEREESGAFHGNQRVRCWSFVHLHDCDYECVAHPSSRGGHGSDSAGIVPSIHSQVLGERSEDNRCLQHLHGELFVRSIDFPKVGDFEHLPVRIIDSTKAIILAVASPSFYHYAHFFLHIHHTQFQHRSHHRIFRIGGCDM